MNEKATKPKNEGRVAACKRLAEWNRKNKENLLKKQEPACQELDQEPAFQEPACQETDQELDQESACQREIALAILAISLFTFLHTSNPTKEAACTKEARKEKREVFDPFR